MDNDPVLQACPDCSTLIDVSEQEPFEQVHCPVCQRVIRARTEFNNFTLVDVLGSGGMGAVYRALDRTLNRYVALKVIRKEFSKQPKHLAQFEREARITASINHPHVVKVFSFGQDHGSFYIAMELVNRGSLDELIAELKKVPEAQALQIGYQIAQGLRAAHNVALIHRDVKPGNILFADARTAKIVDFGLATVFEEVAESRGEVWGTPYYVPPERLKNQPEDLRSDIYSLGATLFHAIAGRPPFVANTASVAALRHIKAQAVGLLEVAPEVSTPTAVVIDRMLKQNPDERFENYDELIEMLAYAHSKAAGQSARAIEGNKRKRKSSLPVLAISVLLLILGSVAYLRLKGEAPNLSKPALNGNISSDQGASQKEINLKYQAALKLLVSGDYQAASSAFGQIEDLPTIKPLMLRWVLFHKALAELLEGNLPASEASFTALDEAGMFSESLQDKPLARFFVETGRLASNSSSPSHKDQVFQENAKPNAFDALKWFVLGLRQWHLGKKEEGAVLLARFNQASFPEELLPYARLGAYKSISEGILLEHQQMAAATNSAKAAEKVAPKELAPQSRKNEVPTAAYKKPISNAVKAATEVSTVSVSLELGKIAKIQQKVRAEVIAYRFASAGDITRSLVLKEKEPLKKREVLLKMAGWLEGFKKTLIEDLNKGGIPFGIRAANGNALEGGIAGATENEVQLKTPYGLIPIAWEKLSPESVLEMAAYYLKKEHDPAAFARRKWAMGIYGCQFGKGKQWRPILAEMAAANAEYADFLEGMLELNQ